MKIEDIDKAVMLKQKLNIISLRLDLLENFDSDKDNNRIQISARGYGPKPDKKFTEFNFEKDENIEIIVIHYQINKYRKQKIEIEKQIESL
jgi:hypothetical protein